MSVQIHCDNCDDSLATIEPSMGGRADTEHVIILDGKPDSYFGGEFPPHRRDFCDYPCLSRWAKKRGEAA